MEKLSARNQLKGKILEVKKGATTSHVRIDIGNGMVITSAITNEAVADLNLKAGDCGFTTASKNLRHTTHCDLPLGVPYPGTQRPWSWQSPLVMPAHLRGRYLKRGDGHHKKRFSHHTTSRDSSSSVHGAIRSSSPRDYTPRINAPGASDRFARLQVHGV